MDLRLTRLHDPSAQERRGTQRIRYYRGAFNVSMGDNRDGLRADLSGSDGSIRLFNTAIVESQSRVMSQKPIVKMLGMAPCLTTTTHASTLAR